ANDAVRVDADALRVRVASEGGNLGFTPQARVAFALKGGAINSDAVDNSAGVDMSDHEVNLKIALQPAIESGALDGAGRDALLAGAREEVGPRVLAQSGRRARIVGTDRVRGRAGGGEFLEPQLALEARAGLDRQQAALPDGETLRARRAGFAGYTRPELAALMAFTKIHLRTALLASAVPDEPLCEGLLIDYFPSELGRRFPDAVRAHRLRREIVAAGRVGLLVDRVGITFVHRLVRDTGAAEATVARAWVIAWELLAGERLTGSIEDARTAAEVDTTCQLLLEATAEGVAHWLVANTGAVRPAHLIVED